MRFSLLRYNSSLVNLILLPNKPLEVSYNIHIPLNLHFMIESFQSQELSGSAQQFFTPPFWENSVECSLLDENVSISPVM